MRGPPGRHVRRMWHRELRSGEGTRRLRGWRTGNARRPTVRARGVRSAPTRASDGRRTASCGVKLALVLPIERPPAAELVDALAIIGIEAQGGYTPCHLLMEHPRARLPYAERVWRHVVCLPLETTFRKGARLSRCLEDW